MKDEKGRACSTHRKEHECIGVFWYENLKARDLCKDIDVNGRIIINRIPEKPDAGMWTVLIWLRIGTSSGLLRTL
jgi:hypothetical protein